MILVDTSAWIEYLRATGSRSHRSLRSAVEADQPLAITDPIAMELLAGARTHAEDVNLRGVIASCEMYPVLDDWDAAALIFRACRAGGETPRALVDCLIAAVAIRVGLPLLAADRDYETIGRHTPLQLS